MKPHLFHPEADQEYAAAAAYYAEISPDLSGRFYDEMERLIREIRQQPQRFLMFDAPVRRHLSRLFPYSIAYLDQPDRIWIVAVMHGSRQPGYWRDRMA